MTSSTPQAGVRAPGRGTLALLRDRRFGPFFAGKVLSSCGIWVQNIAAAVLMFELTRSAFMVGAVSVMQFAAPFLLALWAGALSDRRDRRVILMIGRVLSGSAVGALAVLLVLRGVEDFGGPGPLLLGVAVMGVGLAVSSPAMQALIPALVHDEDLEQALGLNAAGPSIARTVGPALGTGLLLLGGPALAFAVAALAHWIFALVLLLFVRPRPAHRPAGRPALLGGIRYLVTDRTAGLLMLGVAALGLGADPMVTLTPSLADRLGGGGELVGAFATAFGVGAVVLTVFIRPLRQRVSLRSLGIAGFWMLGGGLGVAAFAAAIDPAWFRSAAGLAGLGFFVAGCGFMMGTIALNTRIQRRVPDDLRGRVMALWGLAFLGSRPFAAALNGTIADLASVRAALLTVAALTLLASLLARVRYGDGGPAA